MDLFALALGWSWLLWVPVAALGISQLVFPGILLYALGRLGPPLAAIFLLYRVHSPGSRHDYWRRVDDCRRIGLTWYAVIFVLPFAWNVLGILTGVLLGAPAPSFERAAELLSGPIAIFPFILVVLLFGPLPEELGWRGYGVEDLLGRMSALASSLLLAAVWALWHWPQFFRQDSYIGEVFPMGTPVFWVGWALPTVTYSVMYTWIYNHTGRSILSAILFHFAANFWGELLTGRGEMVVYRSLWIVVMVIAIVAIWGPGTLTRRPRRIDGV